MGTAKVRLSISEQIDRARQGRSQKYIVELMNQAGVKITEVQFSRCKKGPESFSKDQLEVLSEILGTKISL